jgi:hypothetical protein
MTGKYGKFNDEQFKKFKKKLHSKVHWLLLYKEKNNCEFYEKYFIDVMKYFNSLNTVLGDNANILDILVVLQVAFDEVHKEKFDFTAFRRSIFEAHNIIDRL